MHQAVRRSDTVAAARNVQGNHYSQKLIGDPSGDQDQILTTSVDLRLPTLVTFETWLRAGAEWRTLNGGACRRKDTCAGRSSRITGHVGV